MQLLFLCYIFAVAVDDFVPQNRILRFSANQRKLCVTVIIIDDLAVEQRESFIISLERPPDLHNRISISPDRGDVVIPNDDGEIVVCTNEFDVE